MATRDIRARAVVAVPAEGDGPRGSGDEVPVSGRLSGTASGHEVADRPRAHLDERDVFADGRRRPGPRMTATSFKHRHRALVQPGERLARLSPLAGLAAAGILFATSATAREPVYIEAGPDWLVTVSGQLRPRGIVHSGLDFRGDDSEYREHVTQRARLGLAVEEASGIQLAMQLQDVRLWGEEESTTDANAEGFDLHQGYAVVPIVHTLELKVGRQEIIFDDGRLVGNLGWAQRGRTFDAGRLSWSSRGERLRLDAIYAKIQEAGQSPEGQVPDGRDGDVDLGGIRASFELFAGHELAPLYLVNIKQAPNDVRHTAGAHLEGSFGDFSYLGNFYYQYGMIDEDAINAFMAIVRAAYTLPVRVEPALLLWGEVLSGDGTVEGTFDTLYATNHGIYGEMDFFTNIPRDTVNLGLVDLGGRLGTGIVERLRAHVDFHHFRTYAQTPDGEQTFGNEVNVKLVFRANDYVTARGLWGVFFPGEAMRTRFGYGPEVEMTEDHFAYLTLDVAF